MKTHAEHAAVSLVKTRACTDKDMMAGGLCGNCFWRDSYRSEPPPVIDGKVVRGRLSPLQLAGWRSQGSSRARHKTDLEISREKA